MSLFADSLSESLLSGRASSGFSATWSVAAASVLSLQRVPCLWHGLKASFSLLVSRVFTVFLLHYFASEEAWSSFFSGFNHCCCAMILRSAGVFALFRGGPLSYGFCPLRAVSSVRCGPSSVGVRLPSLALVGDLAFLPPHSSLYFTLVLVPMTVGPCFCSCPGFSPQVLPSLPSL